MSDFMETASRLLDDWVAQQLVVNAARQVVLDASAELAVAERAVAEARQLFDRHIGQELVQRANAIAVRA